MRIASWNVNSIKARLGIVTSWLASDHCDVLLIQETKSQDINFPIPLLRILTGMSCFMDRKAILVAIASRHEIEDVRYGLPGDDRMNMHHMEATIDGIRVATIYLPNGNPAPGPKFNYKFDWLDG